MALVHYKELKLEHGEKRNIDWFGLLPEIWHCYLHSTGKEQKRVEIIGMMFLLNMAIYLLKIDFNLPILV